jgi:hypothetical protein
VDEIPTVGDPATCSDRQGHPWVAIDPVSTGMLVFEVDVEAVVESMCWSTHRRAGRDPGCAVGFVVRDGNSPDDDGITAPSSVRCVGAHDGPIDTES